VLLVLTSCLAQVKEQGVKSPSPPPLSNNFKTMPKSKKLQKQIESKLEKLERLLTKIDEAHAINSDDPET
jgi:hypothetical protein